MVNSQLHTFIHPSTYPQLDRHLGLLVANTMAIGRYTHWIGCQSITGQHRHKHDKQTLSTQKVKVYRQAKTKLDNNAIAESFLYLLMLAKIVDFSKLGNLVFTQFFKRVIISTYIGLSVS